MPRARWTYGEFFSWVKDGYNPVEWSLLRCTQSILNFLSSIVVIEFHQQNVRAWLKINFKAFFYLFIYLFTFGFVLWKANTAHLLLKRTEANCCFFFASRLTRCSHSSQNVRHNDHAIIAVCLCFSVCLCVFMCTLYIFHLRSIYMNVIWSIDIMGTKE